MSSKTTFKRLSVAIFIINLIVLVWIVLFKCNVIDWLLQSYHWSRIATTKERFLTLLIPFSNYFTDDKTFLGILELFVEDILNVIVFIPTGMYLSLFIKNKRRLAVTLICFSISLSVEMIQLFTALGAYATLDLITNTLGGIIGYYIYGLIYRDERIKILNRISLGTILVAAPLALYIIVDTALNYNVYFDILLRRI